MQTCTPCVIEAYIEQYGWTYRSFQTSTWKTGRGHEEKSYDFLVHMVANTVRFEISPFVDHPVEWDLWPELTEEIDSLKKIMPLTKLCISEAGDLTLTIESSGDGLDYNNFCNIVMTLTQQAAAVRESLSSTMKNHGLYYYEEPFYMS